MPPKKLCLIDALNQIHRAYHALPELTNSDGIPTNATLGFVTMLRKLISEEKPDYCGVVFDPPGPTVRHAEYAGYKSSRSETPVDLLEQIPWIRRIIEAMDIPILELPSYEADDVIGTLAARAEEVGVRTIIVSEDKDLLQLVSDNVQMLTERNQRVVYGSKEVEDRYGVPPRLMTDLLGLMGDSVDDIPGVPGVGPKRARELLDAYGSLESAVDHAGDLAKYKYGRNLAEYAEQAHLSKRLATIHTDLPIELDLEALEVGEPDGAACRQIFTELEFRRLLDDHVQAPERTEGDYRTVASTAELEAAIVAIRQAGRMAIDLEIDAGQPMRARIVGVGLSWEIGGGVYVPLAHQGLGAANAMRTDECLRLLSPLLGDAEVDIVGHDLKRDLITLERHDVVGVEPQLDIMLASYVLHPTRQSHDLAPLANELLHVRLTELKEILPDRKATFDAVPIAEATRYAAERADLTLRLAKAFDSALEAQPGLGALLADLEMPLMRVLVAMELRGVRIDTGYLAEMSSQFAKRIESLQAGIYEIAGESFNLNSPKQLAEVLFDRLELPAGGKTAKGSRSTKAEVLEALAQDYPIVSQILEYREFSKLKSTYVDALPGYVLPDTGRVHGSFDQAVAATGRLSSSSPNLQNIPIRRSTGRQIRRAFIPADGCLLMTADYSQVELRIMAHLSGDPSLQQAFLDGIDIHRATAAQIFHVEPDDVTSEQRDRAKAINFGVLYGMGPQRLAREFDVSLAEAKDFIQRYFGAYPRVRDYLDATIERAREEGFVTTLLGRVRHLPELQSGRPMVRSFGERIAVNTPLQGTAADLVKLAMVNLHARLAELELSSVILIQVHDELVVEVPEPEIHRVSEVVKHEMESAIELDVPLLVEISVGANWMDAKG
jgi:DNA polymerase-1